MCGRFQILKNKKSKKLLNKLDVDESEILFSRDKAPGSRISIIQRVKDRNVVTKAIWWLLIDPDTGKPNYKYASFNSRSDKLNSPRAIAYEPFRNHAVLSRQLLSLKEKGTNLPIIRLNWKMRLSLLGDCTERPFIKLPVKSSTVPQLLLCQPCRNGRQYILNPCP